MSQKITQANLLLKAASAMKSDQVAQGLILWVWNTTRDGGSLTSLGNLIHHLAVLMVNFFITRNKIFLNCINNAGFNICGDSVR